MPGRRGKLSKLDFEQLPMTFSEFCRLIEPEIDQNEMGSLIHHRDLLLHRFREYLISGGFPLSVNLFFSNGHISSYVYQLYLSWIEGDIGRSGKLIRNLYQIMSRILAHISTAVSWYGLSREAGIASHATVQEYVEILERMYVLRSVPFINISSKMAMFRKNRKLYLQDPLIFHFFSGRESGISDNFFTRSLRFLNDPEGESKLVESVVGMHINRAYKNCFYWQGPKEIDFVAKQRNKLVFFEVKYREKISVTDFEWFGRVCSKGDRLNIVTKRTSKEGEFFRMIPVPIFLIQLENDSI